MTQVNLNYPTPPNEALRLKALKNYHILDTAPEHEYDCITRIAAQICNTPVSLIALLDKSRQWFKSHTGFQITETPREWSFCNYTIMDPSNLLVVPDLRKDDRFSANPLVTGNPHVVFYAGAPLTTPDGFALGSICVLDAKANTLNKNQGDTLMDLAQQVMAQMELRKKIRELNEMQLKLTNANRSLKDFAHVVSHDMKTPLANILLLNRTFKRNYGSSFDQSAGKYIDLIEESANELLEFIDQILVSPRNNTDPTEIVEQVDSGIIIKKIINLIAPPEDIDIRIVGPLPNVKMDRTSLQQVFQNLITNAIKYNDKSKAVITVSSQSDEAFHHISIADNGSGIGQDDLQKIFKEKQTLDKTDRFGNKGTGIGLATVKNIIQSFQGQITVSSQKHEGSIFKVSIPNY